MSPDGRYVAFLSAANNLVAGITSGVNTYWRDVNLGQTVGLQGANSFIFDPSLGGNGRYIAYASNGSPFSQNSWLKIRYTQLGVDIYTNTGAVTSASIDPTGTKILYWMGDNPYWIANTLYVDDIATGTNLFSIPSKAPIRNATGWSDDGRWLTFVSSTNPVSGDDGTNKVYLRDFQTGTLSLIGTIGPSNSTMDVSSDVSVMSGNGRFVAYRSAVINTVIGDNTTPPNVFLLDRLTGSNTVLTAGQTGSSPMLWASRPVISDGGATIAFLDLGPGLATGDLNRLPDAFGVSVNTSAALVDSDADGIPDWWMMKYFGHPTGQAGDFSLASDDADGDGVSNLQEYLAGTDPTSRNSNLAVAITNGGAFRSLIQPLADGLRIGGILVLWAAGLLAIWGVRTMGRQLVSAAEVRPDTKLVTTGAFGLVRHPLYDSVLMLWAGGTLALLNYVLGAGFVLLVPAFYLRARAEEAILTRHFGDAYAAYAARVPMLVPRLRRPLP